MHEVDLREAGHAGIRHQRKALPLREGGIDAPPVHVGSKRKIPFGQQPEDAGVGDLAAVEAAKNVD